MEKPKPANEIIDDWWRLEESIAMVKLLRSRGQLTTEKCAGRNPDQLRMDFGTEYDDSKPCNVVYLPKPEPPEDLVA